MTRVFDNKEYWTYQGLQEMVMWSTTAAGHDMHPSVILLLKNDKVINNIPFSRLPGQYS